MQKKITRFSSHPAMLATLINQMKNKKKTFYCLYLHPSKRSLNPIFLKSEYYLKKTIVMVQNVRQKEHV